MSRSYICCGVYATFRHKGNYDAAVSMLRDLLQKNPKHAAGYLQLARMFSTRYSTDHINRKEDCSAIIMKMIADILEEALECYEKAILLTTDVSIDIYLSVMRYHCPL